MPDETVFTIGHSNHEIEKFIELLNSYEINCIIDVRSSPYSRRFPQYNKPALMETLKQHNIIYMHFEKEFGARHTKPSLLDETGRVDFDKVRESDDFKQGVQRVRNGLEKGFKIALMCSEGNPLDCHRFSMISYQLVKEGFTVKHILPDGEVEENSKLEDDLLQMYAKKLPQTNLFETVTRKDQLEWAYRQRGRDVAFSALKTPEEEDVT